MTDTITCPTCQERVVLGRDKAQALCSDCHDMDDAQLAAELQKRVDRALWVALRSVEDQAAYARWASSKGKPVPPDAAQSKEAADLLRRLLTWAGRSD